ncbi:MAG: type II toxin-antitoxin system ParD family antitoxin [Leptolyngbyaceae cyanobacterium SU_3_3]|nr:type II toxin-antitoxin system ParD family antitoxin [Leptolyngbyaceae cyanobacterium SU_3_3]NJR50933.1 type II toxin-antitoxin system ParD family antitoxin [Leptolyngbyaceae cyanobacterium CSU_1_3]
MNISLPPELESFVQSQVADGMFISASEVIQTALRLLQEQSALQTIRQSNLKQEIQTGIDDLEQGRYTTYATAQDLAVDIKQPGRQQRHQSHNP